MASLGVSKEGGGGGKVVERVLSVSFLTDPVFKPTDLAGKGAAAVASLFGSVGSAAAALSSISSGSSSSAGSGGAGAVGAGKAGGIAGSAGGGPPSAVEIANARSNQRAESLLQAIVVELGEVGWGDSAAGRETERAAVVVPGVGGGGGPPQAGSSPLEKEAPEEGEVAVGAGGVGLAQEPASAVRREEVLVLAPFDGVGGDDDTGVSGATAASSSSPVSSEEADGTGAADGQRQRPSQEEDQEAGEAVDRVGKASGGARADTSGARSAAVEVIFCSWEFQVRRNLYSFVCSTE